MKWYDDTALINEAREFRMLLRGLAAELHDEKEKSARDRGDVWKAIGDFQNLVQSLKTSPVPSTESARVDKLDARLAELWGLLTEKSQTTGKQKLTRTGRTIAGFYKA